jgi:hypothetical protein
VYHFLDSKSPKFLSQGVGRPGYFQVHPRGLFNSLFVFDSKKLYNTIITTIKNNKYKTRKMPERAIEHVVDQQTTIEIINDEDNVNVIRTTDSLTSGEMLHLEMYSFFKYDHPHDDDEKKFKHSVCHNFLLNNNNMCHIFAMAIGIPEFSKMTETAPFTQTKKKEYTNVFRPL